MNIQFSHKDGLLVANSLHQYFLQIPEVTSCIFCFDNLKIDHIIENKMSVVYALEQQNRLRNQQWNRIKERWAQQSPIKQPPSTHFSQYLQDQPLLSPVKSTNQESIMNKTCLLERSFPTQQQAITFIDNFRTYEKDIKLFSYERLSDKRRLFVALNQEEFQWEYVTNPTNSNPLQHAYEIIRENCPCKLYMDVEFLYKFNPGLVGVQVLNTLLQFISTCLFYQYGEIVTPADYSCIFSENPDKFSCHVVLNKNQLYFKNNIHLGRFMEWCVNVLSHSPHSEFASLFIHTKDSTAFVADMAVYTKNRAMRLLKSSKHSTDKSKKPFNTVFSLDEWQLFLPYTLVTGTIVNSPSVEFYFYQQPLRLLYMKTDVTAVKTPTVRHQRQHVLRSDSFPYQSLSQQVLTGWEFVSHQKGAFIRSWTYWEGKMGGWKIRFEIGGNRYCMNKRREHKSNHIYIIVDLKRSCFYQKCHDTECSQYISPSFSIPMEETEPVIEFFAAEKLISSL